MTHTHSYGWMKEARDAGQLMDFHGDPADRMIVATALENAASLMTADQKILNWNTLHQKIDASL